MRVSVNTNKIKLMSSLNVDEVIDNIGIDGNTIKETIDVNDKKALLDALIQRYKSWIGDDFIKEAMNGK